MFAPKQDTFKRDYPFENNINQLKKDIEHDYKEVGKLYDIVLEGKSLSLVISILEAEIKRYKEQLDFLLFSEEKFISHFEDYIPSFAYNSLFVSQYCDLNDFYFPFRGCLIAEQDGDIFSPNHRINIHSDKPLEKDNDFRAEFWEKDNSNPYNDESYIFTEKSYNANIDCLNKECGFPGHLIAPVYCYWKEVLSEADNISIIRKKVQLIYAFYNDTLKPMLDKLQPAPTNEIEQDIANGKPWKENHEAVVKAFPDFGKHFDRLKEQGYITVDNNKKRFTWNKGKAVLARYFDRITIDGYETQWSVVKALFENIKPADNLRAMVTRNPGSKEYSKLCDILGITESK